jgi:hypothetical protein
MNPKHGWLSLSKVKTKEINRKNPQKKIPFLIIISLSNSLMKKIMTIVNTL